MPQLNKVLVLVTILFVVSANTAWAQPGGQLALKTGITKFGFSGEGQSSEDFSGFGSGLHYVHGISDSFGIQIELLYVQKGAKHVLSRLDSYFGSWTKDIYSSYKFGYLELPLLLKWNPVNDIAYILTGPTFGYRVSESSEWDDDYVTIIGYELFNVPLLPPVKTSQNDLNFLVGVGFHFVSGTTGLLLEGRYQWGLADVSIGDAELRNNGLTLLAGITYENPL